MSAIATRFHQSLLAAFLFQITILAGCSIAKVHQGNWLGAQQHRGWGLKNRAKLPLSTSGSQTLGSYLSQVRGGSSYGGGDDDGYYGDDKSDSKGQDGYYNDDRYNNKGFDSRDWAKDDYYQGDDRNDSRRGNGYDEYDDRGRSSSGSSNAAQSSLSSFQAKIRNGDRRLGVPLLAAGVTLTMLGVSMFFNKSLMRLGNLMIIAGVPTTIGPTRTAGYFFKPEKTRATACLFAGIFLVFVGWPIFGIALEVFGILNLFGNMFPMFWAIFKNMPIVSSITKSAGSGRDQSYSYDRERNQDYRDDPYADDRRGYDDYRDDSEPYY